MLLSFNDYLHTPQIINSSNTALNFINNNNLNILFQIYQAFPYNIEEEYELKYLQVKNQIQTVVKEYTEDLVLARERQKFLVTTAEQSLEKEIEQLNQYIKETTIKAERESKDISHCITDEDIINKLSSNIEKLETCHMQPSLDFLQKELNYFMDQYNTFSDMVATCIENEEQVTFGTTVIDGRHPCVDKNISEIELRMSVVEQLSSLLLENGYNSCLNCLKNQIPEVDKEIISFARNYANCVDEIFGTEY